MGIKWAKTHTVLRKVPGTQWVSTKEVLQLRRFHPGLSQRPLECPWDLGLAHISSQLTACPPSPHGRGEGCAYPQPQHLTQGELKFTEQVHRPGRMSRALEAKRPLENHASLPLWPSCFSATTPPESEQSCLKGPRRERNESQAASVKKQKHNDSRSALRLAPHILCPPASSPRARISDNCGSGSGLQPHPWVPKDTHLLAWG